MQTFSSNKKKAIAIFLYLFCISTAYSQSFIKRFNAISSFTKLNSSLLFAADDGIHGVELWKTDGTVPGTTLVKDINPGSASAVVSSLYAFNGKCYFAANDGINGQELWQTDGTASGTVMLKNINTSQTGNNGSQPSQFTTFNGALYFVAASDGSTYSLWKTDGTSAGTVQITQPDYSGVSQLTPVGNTLYFTKSGNQALWKTDGTVTGTQQVTVDDYYFVDLLHNVNNKLVFITNTTNRQNIRLYEIDPANNSQTLLQSFNAVTYGSNDIDNITAVGSSFYFSIRTDDANDNANDALWVSDGTTTGTKSLISSKWENHLSGSYMQDFVAFNNKLYFANTGSFNLYTSDGTPTGTVPVSNVVMSTVSPPVISNQKLYFNGNSQLWSLNGATASAGITSPSNPLTLFDVNGTLYFTAKGTFTTDLWNNTPASQLQVTMNYQALANGGSVSFTSKADSIITNTVTIQNTGTKELVFSDISVAGNAFYVNGSPNQVLLPGKQTTFNLLYAPIKQEQTSAILNIKTNDNSGQNNFSENLTGTSSGISTNNKNPLPLSLQKAIVFADSIPDFTLSTQTIAENAPINTTIGSFQITDSTASYQYSLTAGTGSADNASFAIVNGQLTSLTTFNFNNKSTYSIRVKASNKTDSLVKIFPIQVSQVQSSVAGSTCVSLLQLLTYSLSDAVYANSRIVAVGTAGTLLISDDSGNTWKMVNTGITTDFNKVVFPSQQIGYILGSGNILLKSEDGGNTWFPLSLPTTIPSTLTNLFFASPTVGYLIGGTSIYKTADGGHTWTTLNANTYSTLTSLWFTDVNNGFACGSSETVIHTTDGGATWVPVAVTAIGSSANLNNITFANSTTGYITSSAGDVLQTTDGGATWARISTVSTDQVNRIYFLNTNTGYLLTGYNSPLLYKTTDGGKTWQMESNLNYPGSLLGLAYNNTTNNLCLVGHGVGLGYTSQQGSLIYLENGSGSWTIRSYVGNDNYTTGYFLANNTVYVLGVRNLKSTDGGTTWSQLNINTAQVTAGYFISADTGFYADYYNVYKTTNGGNSWVKTNTDSSSVVSTIYFHDSQTGFYNAGQFLFRTTDGGNTWSKVLSNQNSLSTLNSITFVDQQTGYAGGDGSMIYKTVDNGATWVSQNIDNNDFLTGIYFLNPQIGLIGGANGLLLRTTDGGQTWNQVISGMQFYITAFQFTDSQHGYALNKAYSGGVNQIYETTDAGLTWTVIYQTYTNIAGFNLANNQLFITGDAGLIMKMGNINTTPVNAGYIVGDTTVAVSNKVIYTAPNISGTNYTWTISGQADVEYHNNYIEVAWKQAGQYTLQVTPYNSCGMGSSRTLNVTVVDMPAPKVIGPDTVLNHAKGVVYTAGDKNGGYNWSATGNVSLTPANNQVTVNWGNPGNGILTLVEADSTLNLEKSTSLNVIIQNGPYSLPDSNFNITINGSTCKGSNNGSIDVKASEQLNYTAILTSPDNTTHNYSFTDSLNINNLSPGSYNICFGIAGNSTYQRCYTLNLTEPKDLSLYTTVDQSSGKLTLDMSGGNNYFIELNGNSYQTNSTQLQLPLITGANSLKVYTDKLCQGTVQKVINFNRISIYPDPFTNQINIDLGGNTITMANIIITDNSGRQIYNKNVQNQNGILNLDVSGFNNGLYILKLTLGQSSTSYKIMKK